MTHQTKCRVMKRPRGSDIPYVPLDHWFPNQASAQNMARELSVNPAYDDVVVDDSGRTIVGAAGDIVEESK